MTTQVVSNSNIGHSEFPSEYSEYPTFKPYRADYSQLVSNPVLVTNDNIGYALLALEAADDIAVDTETSGLNVRNKTDYLMGVCVHSVSGNNAFAGYIPFRHPSGNVDLRYLEALINIFKNKPLIWHNRKFDMHSFASIGVNPLEFKGPQFDTLMIATLVNEELYSKELDYLAKRYLKGAKQDSDMIHKMGAIYGYENLEPKVYEQYGPHDSYLTRGLRDVLYPKLVQQELSSVYWDTEAPFTELLYLMEQRGVGIRSDFAENKARVGRGRMGTISRELKINPASTTDLGRFLLQELNLPVFAHTSSCNECAANMKAGKRPQDYLHTHEGKPSFNKVAMAEYDDVLSLLNNPAAKRITEFRGWQKAVTSLYEPMLEKRGPDGRLRTEFKQHGTVTGRLSSSNPNLQQIPRSTDKSWNGNSKYGFISGYDDFDLIGWDWSQLELRLAAAYGREQLLLTEFEKDDADPFRVLAPQIFGTYSEEYRHKTKNGFVYPSLYGAGLPKVALSIGHTVEETKPLYERYKRSIAGITAVSGQIDGLIKARGYVKYWDGRRRHFRDKSDSFKGWNSVLQGGGAQLVKKAMLRCRKFEDENCFMVLQVHDEIVFCIRKGMRHIYEPLIIEAMTDFKFLGVKMAVDGKPWGVLKEA